MYAVNNGGRNTYVDLLLDDLKPCKLQEDLLQMEFQWVHLQLKEM